MPSKKVKDSKRLKQTTLFDSPKRNLKKHSIKKLSAKTAHSSDDGDMNSGPVTFVSSDEEDVPSPPKLSHKRHLTRLASESPSEAAQLSSASQNDPDTVPRKRRRIRRRSSENDIAEVDNMDQLVDEVDEEGVFRIYLLRSMISNISSRYSRL
jgi:hypothetical protein